MLFAGFQHIADADDKYGFVFFGDEVCIKIIQSFGDKSLSDYTDEEDFMLGTMLGYDHIQQCERYIKRKNLI